MATRIGDYVIAGEQRNNRRNSVAGWIEFAPDWGIRIELAGNLKGQFAGKTLSFRTKIPPEDWLKKVDLPELDWEEREKQKSDRPSTVDDIPF